MATPRPMKVTRNCTTTDTWVASASGQRTRKVVGMAMTAMSRGTRAISEPNTRTAPRGRRGRRGAPPPHARPVSAPSSLASASRPLMRTGAPATSRPPAAAWAWSRARPAGSKAVSAADTRGRRRWCARPRRRRRDRRCLRMTLARSGHRRGDACEGRGQLAPHAGRVHRGALGQLHDRHEGPVHARAAVAVAGGDQVGGLRGLVPGEIETPPRGRRSRAGCSRRPPPARAASPAAPSCGGRAPSASTTSRALLLTIRRISQNRRRCRNSSRLWIGRRPRRRIPLTWPAFAAGSVVERMEFELLEAGGVERGC